MALKARNSAHKQQIEAGTKGRKRGHKFEELLTKAINECDINKIDYTATATGHLYRGNPAVLLLSYIARSYSIEIIKVHAWWLGGLATSGDGDVIIDEHGNPITKCKSDVVIEITHKEGVFRTGISVKTCSKKTPTNDQMYFTTASAFCKLLEDNGVAVSSAAKEGLSQFCGDAGYRPLDKMSSDALTERKSDPRRYYWEELSAQAQTDWAEIFQKYQDHISQLLFQKAYKSDPYPPDFLFHQTVKYDSFDECPVALFTICEIVKLSREHCGYVLTPYKIRKGTYKNDPNEHLAPRFGFIQFQRGGQKQHPTQLQFNLKAGYFNHLK